MAVVRHLGMDLFYAFGPPTSCAKMVLTGIVVLKAFVGKMVENGNLMQFYNYGNE